VSTHYISSDNEVTVDSHPAAKKEMTASFGRIRFEALGTKRIESEESLDEFDFVNPHSKSPHPSP
jgi:hypothetical protein